MLNIINWLGPPNCVSTPSRKDRQKSTAQPTRPNYSGSAANGRPSQPLEESAKCRHNQPNKGNLVISNRKNAHGWHEGLKAARDNNEINYSASFTLPLPKPLISILPLKLLLCLYIYIYMRRRTGSNHRRAEEEPQSVTTDGFSFLLLLRRGARLAGFAPPPRRRRCVRPALAPGHRHLVRQRGRRRQRR